MTERGERLFALLLQLYPRDFRERYGGDLVAFFRQDRDHPRYGSGPLRPLRFWTATTRDLMQTVWSHRRESKREQPRASRTGRWIRDCRVAWRGLWSAPLVTLAALAVLTVGIGASTSIFSVVDAVVLRGLPYPADDELVYIRETAAAGVGQRPVPVRPQTFDAWRQRQRVFAALGASRGSSPLVTVDEPVQTFTTSAITASLLEVLGGRPAFGRAFTTADEQPGARRVALLSDAAWRSRFGADRTIVGRTIPFKSGPVEIVGVMPPGFRYPVAMGADLWLPLVLTPAQMVRGRTHFYALTVIARLPPGTALDQASVQMNMMQNALTAEDPSWFGEHGFSAQLWRDAIVGSSVRSWMMLLLAAVAGVLLIACLNVANLLVARAFTRAPELAMRAALGASRWDLSRALLLESLMLSVIGALAGVVLAVWGVEILRASLPASVPRLSTVALDLRVMIVAAGAALATGLVFGTLPALQVSRPDLVALVSQGARSHAGGRGSRRLRAALVVGEVAVASVLLVGSGLFLSSFVRVTSIELGFDPRHVLSVTGGIASTSAVKPATTPEDRAEAMSAQTKIADALMRLRAVPGVAAVAAAGGGRPLGGTTMTVDMRLAEAAPGDVVEPEPFVRGTTPGYLDVMRGTLLRGRWISDADVLGTEPVMVLSDEAARAYFGSRDPIGQRVLLDDYPHTIVGVVRAMRSRGPESETAPEVFVSLFQGSHTGAELIVRTEQDPLPLVPALHAAVRSALPEQALVSRPWEQDYARLLEQRKFNMLVLSLFGIVAIVVAALGIYGLMAFLVEQRRREIGVRVALGAEPVGILRMVLGRASTLMAIGLVVGVAAAGLLEGLVRAFLFQPEPHDPIVYAGAALTLFVAGIAAAFGPARRAARVDPLIALRAD